MNFTNIDLTKHPEKEIELKKKTGAKIVPGIIIKKTGLLGLFSKEKHFIGFEQNKEVIENLLLN